MQIVASQGGPQSHRGPWPRLVTTVVSGAPLRVQPQRNLPLQKIMEKFRIRLAELTNFLETPLKSELKLFLFDAEITAVTNIQPSPWFMCSLRMGSVRVAQFSNLCFLPPSSAILISHVFSGVGYLQTHPSLPAFIPLFPISPATPCSQIIKYSASCNVTRQGEHFLH